MRSEEGLRLSGRPDRAARCTQIVAKTGGMMTQWDILISMGMSPDDCLPFVDPIHWLKFFPPLGKQDLIKFGACID